MEQCLQLLDENTECENDHILVQQVRLQLIVEQTRPKNEHYIPGLTKAPLEFYVHALQSQLDEIKKRLDFDPNQYGNGKASFDPITNVYQTRAVFNSEYSRYNNGTLLQHLACHPSNGSHRDANHNHNELSLSRLATTRLSLRLSQFNQILVRYFLPHILHSARGMC